jgi:hypothetical protein
MRYALLALSCLPLCALGCGSKSKEHFDARAEAQDEPASMHAPRKKMEVNAPQFGAPDEDGERARAKGEAKEETPRKIIFTAKLDLIVEDFDKAVEALNTAIGEQKGFVAASDVRGERGRPRSGVWTVRVPQEHFDALVAAVAKLGEALHNRRDSQDVTEGYYDTRERLKTFEVEEEGLRKYYADRAPTAKPEDMMAVRRELTQLRAQIEELKGRLRRWDNQVDLATVVVNLSERKEYVPPVVPNSPVVATFGGTIGEKFRNSIDGIVDLGKNIVFGAVGAAPWVALVAVVGGPLWLRLWRLLRSRKRLPGPVATPPAIPGS